MLKGLPSAVRLYNLLSSDEVCPLTVKEGQEFSDVISKGI